MLLLVWWLCSFFYNSHHSCAIIFNENYNYGKKYIHTKDSNLSYVLEVENRVKGRKPNTYHTLHV